MSHNLEISLGSSEWIAIAVSVVAAFIIGFVWFTFLFGKQWAKEFGMSMDDGGDMKSMLPSMIKDIIGAALMAYVMVWMIMWIGDDAIDHTAGLYAALFAWSGFMVPVALTRTGWEKRSWAWFGIDVGYQLVKLIAMALIIVAFIG